MLKLSVQPEKIKTAGRGETACRQFQFFSGRIWQFQHFMSIKNFNFDTETDAKTVMFICQFSTETVRQ